MMNLVERTNRTPVEVVLRIDDEGRTSAKALYEVLELNPTHYSRWCKKNILENAYAAENVDFTPLAMEGERNPNPTTDYKLSASFAKKLAMASNSKRGDEVRNYFVAVEERLKQNAIAQQSGLSPELQMLKGLFDHAVKTENQIAEIRDEVQAIKRRQDASIVATYETDAQMELVSLLANERYSTTDIARVFGMKGAVKLNRFLSAQGIIEPPENGRGWIPTPQYADKGYTITEATVLPENPTILWWTAEGAEWLIGFLEKQGLKKKSKLKHEPSRKVKSRKKNK